MTDNTFDKAQKNVDTATDKVQQAANEASRKASETAAVVKDQAKRTVSQVTDQAKTNVDSRMGEVASELGTVAEAVRQTSEDLGGHDQEMIARYGNRIADQIESVSNYLNNRGVEDVLADVEGLARRQPALFLGGAFTLGLLVGRFLRSSSQNMGYQGGYGGYQDYPGGGSGSYGDYGYTGSSYSGGGQSGTGYGGGSTAGRSATSGGSSGGAPTSTTGGNAGAATGSTRTGQSAGQGASGRPAVEGGAETGANEPTYTQGPSVYNTSNQEEFGDNPTAYPTGLAEE